MTEEEFVEAASKLKLKVKEEKLLRNKIVMHWDLEIPLGEERVATVGAEAFIRISGLEDKEQNIKIVESFIKNLLICRPEKFKQIIERSAKE